MEPTTEGLAAYHEIERAIELYMRDKVPGSDTPRGYISHSIREWPGEGKRRFGVVLSSGITVEVTLEQTK